MVTTWDNKLTKNITNTYIYTYIYIPYIMETSELLDKSNTYQMPDDGMTNCK